MAKDSFSGLQNLSQENLQNIQQINKEKENMKDVENQFQKIQNSSTRVLGKESKY